MAEELDVLREVIEQELDLATDGIGYESSGVADDIVRRYVAPLRAEGDLLREAVKALALERDEATAEMLKAANAYRDERDRAEASRQAWAEEAMRQSSELNHYADLLLTCAESPSPEHLGRMLRRMAARRPQACPFVSDSGNGCEDDEGHDGPHTRWFDEIRYEVLAGPPSVCACVTDEQAEIVRAGGFSRPVCTVHPEGDEA